jgi:molecular chaperone Hsp33
MTTSLEEKREPLFERDALMPDLLLGATAGGSGASIFAAVTTNLVAEIQRRHDLSPTATAAVGRLVTGAVLFGASLSGRERISLQISGNGPIGTIVADSWLLDERTIGARGYARNGRAELPIDARGKFDVAGAIGGGTLQVTKSYEVGQPYVGVVPLHSGEIAEDLAAYLAKSEQIPSVVALGVLANPGGVVAAGGVLAQVLPGASEAAIAHLEERARSMPPVTTVISELADPRQLLDELSGQADLRTSRSMDVRFACLCTKRKVEVALLGLGRAELERMNDERDETEATCEFCQRRYVFMRAEIAALIDRLRDSQKDR